MRRAFVLLLAGMPLLAGCVLPLPGGPTGRPQDWVPPHVESATISSDQLTPGSTFSISVTATDDVAVLRLSLTFRQPNGDRFDLVDCRLGDDEDDSYWLLKEPGPVVSEVIDCEMPFAPNGEWEAELIPLNEGSLRPGPPLEGVRIPFQVTGGSDDTEHPTLESVHIPEPVVVGSWFDVTVRLSDNHSLEPVQREPTMRYTGVHSRPCFSPELTRISATEHEWTFSCQANTGGRPGVFTGYVNFYDAAGNYTTGTFDFEMLHSS